MTSYSRVKISYNSSESFGQEMNEQLKQEYEELLAKDMKAKMETFTRERQGEAPLAHEPNLAEDTEAKAS